MEPVFRGLRRRALPCFRASHHRGLPARRVRRSGPLLRRDPGAPTPAGTSPRPAGTARRESLPGRRYGNGSRPADSRQGALRRWTRIRTATEFPTPGTRTMMTTARWISSTPSPRIGANTSTRTATASGTSRIETPTATGWRTLPTRSPWTRRNGGMRTATESGTTSTMMTMATGCRTGWTPFWTRTPQASNWHSARTWRAFCPSRTRNTPWPGRSPDRKRPSSFRKRKGTSSPTMSSNWGTEPVSSTSWSTDSTGPKRAKPFCFRSCARTRPTRSPTSSTSWTASMWIATRTAI